MKVRISAVHLISCALLLLSLSAWAIEYPPNMPDSRSEVYRSTDEQELRIWIFEPRGHASTDQRPAVVFFFGGGWRAGSPAQFQHHAGYLAERGMVAMIADYRVRSRHSTTISAAVDDARAAIRWAKINASRLGVDPERIAAAGGSAGGHLALMTAMLPGATTDSRDEALLPHALVLFNPVFVLAEAPGLTDEANVAWLEKLQPHFGADPVGLSPYHQIRPGLPPAIIFHGTADSTVPFRHAEEFTNKMTSADNQCELVSYDGQGHAFFNYGRGDGSAYNDTIKRTHKFFISLDWLPAE